MSRKIYLGDKKERHRAAVKRYAQTKNGKAVRKQYGTTLRGYLGITFRNMKARCTNPKSPTYNFYGGRGIKCLFNNVQEFIDYVMNNLSFNPPNKPHGLEIHRIDNNGHYAPGNIEFLNISEHKKKHLTNHRKRGQ